jgi:hypothetical protein
MPAAVATNDNLDTLRSYQRRGLKLSAVPRRAVDQARRIKRSIPLGAAFEIRTHDELELELRSRESVAPV